MDPKIFKIFVAGLGTWLAVFLLGSASLDLSNSLLIGSMASSCVLIFGYPEVHFSQPRNVILGHFMCSLWSLLILYCFGNHLWNLALATALSVMWMMATNTVHPPAGANSVIIFFAHSSWKFLFFPVLLGPLILVALGILIHRLMRTHKYPVQWY